MDAFNKSVNKVELIEHYTSKCMVLSTNSSFALFNPQYIFYNETNHDTPFYATIKKHPSAIGMKICIFLAVDSYNLQLFCLTKEIINALCLKE